MDHIIPEADDPIDKYMYIYSGYLRKSHKGGILIRGQILNTVFPCVFGEGTFRTYMDQWSLLLDSLYIEAGILIIMFSITRTIGTHIFI